MPCLQPISRRFCRGLPRHGERVLGGLLILLLGGCSGVSLRPAGPYSDLTPEQATRTHAVGTRVRWGGEIITTQPRAKSTCFTVLALFLDAEGEPRLARTRSLGRFVACSPGFYDPALFSTGRQITIAGNITRFETHRVGGYDYLMPVLAAGAPHLWPIKPVVRYLTVPVAPLWYPIYVAPPRSRP